MALEVSIQGAATLHRVAARMREQGRKDLSREMGQALSQALDPVRVSIEAEAEKVMPSGYVSLLTKSLRHRVSRRNAGQQARVILATYADGTKERRDILALNAGRLRHPVWGRSRRIKIGVRKGTILANPWALTTIRSGFHDRGVDGALDEARDAMISVVDEYAARLL